MATERRGCMRCAAAILRAPGAGARPIVGGDGISNFLGNIFSGQKLPLRRSRRQPRLRRRSRCAAALDRRRRRLRPSPDDRERDPQAAANFEIASPRCGPMPPGARLAGEFQRFTAGLTPDLRIMDLMDSQPEFTKSIWDYLDILVNDNRLAKGREILANTSRNSTRRKKPMASTAMRSPRSGASS